MLIETVIRHGEYYDSVKLMIATKQLSEFEGVTDAVILMGSDLNKEVLTRTGLLTPESEAAVCEDLIIAVKAETQEAIDKAMAAVDGLLNQHGSGDDGEEYRPKSFDSAMKAVTGLNFCIISVPGKYAKGEAMKALKNDMHVLLFSDNVTKEEELELKTYARDNGLLLMGPDCGTAMINNVPLGFANKVRKGNIGMVGAAGTGMQEVMVLIHKLGGGISQAIGTGGRDLSLEIGGITMLQGIEALNNDPETKVIVVISKPPAEEISDKILTYIKENVKKPTVINFIGGDKSKVEAAGKEAASTLEEAAIKAVKLAEVPCCSKYSRENDDELTALAAEQAKLIKPGQKYLRGLYSGGTLCYESMLVLRDYIGDVYSNTPLNKKMKLADANVMQENSCVDYGDDKFTVGRAHPMIDTTLREEEFVKEIEKEDVAVILLDVVIGYGTHKDPAGVFAKKIKQAKEKMEKKGIYIPIICYICGTEEDPQNWAFQKATLEEAGAIVVSSNAKASKLAGMIMKAL
ncbi:MAG: acyl-CoA synthetase FdrA [Lutispora sp.]|nr:acyl-CoA synthetase FdrA [Lutispora sp.]